MSSKLETNIATVKAKFEAIRASYSPSRDVVTWYDSQRYLNTNKGFFELVWFPTRETEFVRSEQVNVSKQTLWSYLCNFEVHLFGDTRQAIDEMLEDFVSACHWVLGASFVIDSGEWALPTELVKGEAYTLFCAIKQPLQVKQPLTQTITTIAVADPTDNGNLQCNGT